MSIKPNHKCMNCGTEYYACNYCDKVSYRKWFCSFECYLKSGWRINESMRPSRTDLTIEEIDELMSEPIEVLKIKSMEDLKEYINEINEIGFDGVMDIVNRKIKEGDL